MMKNVNFAMIAEQELTAVNGGMEQIVGVHTPLGDYPAEELIEMYEQQPDKAVQYVALAKAFCPGLADEFVEECSQKGLEIPEGLKDLLGI